MNENSKPASRRKKNGHGLTDLEIRALKPTIGAKGVLVRKRYPDGNGLFLVVGPTGSKWWEYRFAFEGKKTGIGLGTYPVITLAVAREKHLAARRELAEGRNPATTGKKAQLGAAKLKAASEAAKASAGALTFASLAESWLENREKNGIKRVEETRGRLKNHVFPTLGNVPIKDISAAKVLEAILAIKAKGLEEMAKRCLSSIRQIFNYAMIREWADRNPAEPLTGIGELRRSTPPKHQRALKTPAELGQLLLDIETISDTLAGKALDLAPYVFVRAGELAGARWAEIDMDSSLWQIPAERMKANGEHIVPLASQVKERLEALRKMTGWSPCVFPALTMGQAPMNPESLRRALNRLGYGPGALVSHTTHGFKSVASTFLREQGFNPAWIELQLAHGERNKVVAAYNHADYIPQRQDMMQSWADYLDELREKARSEARSIN